MAMVAPARGERERGVGEMAAALGRQRGPLLTQSGRDRSAPGSTRASCLSPTDVDTLHHMACDRHTDDWEEPDTACASFRSSLLVVRAGVQYCRHAVCTHVTLTLECAR